MKFLANVFAVIFVYITIFGRKKMFSPPTAYCPIFGKIARKWQRQRIKNFQSVRMKNQISREIFLDHFCVYGFGRRKFPPPSQLVHFIYLKKTAKAEIKNCRDKKFKLVEKQLGSFLYTQKWFWMKKIWPSAAAYYPMMRKKPKIKLKSFIVKI